MRGDIVGNTPTGPDELRRDIEQTRAELGETVEALAAKADVKARAQEAAQEAADEARERVNTAVDSVAYQVGRQRERFAKLDPRVRVGLFALVAGLVALLVIRKVRGRSS
jgi:ElaB/YqjD/DUF883 family membrane-anchored ribosome-binding protein